MFLPMKLTQEDIFNIIVDLKPTLSDIKLLTSHVAKILKIETCEKLTQELKIQMKAFKRKQQSKALQSSWSRLSHSHNNYCVDSEGFTPVENENDQAVDGVEETLKEFIVAENDNVNSMNLNQRFPIQSKPHF